MPRLVTKPQRESNQMVGYSAGSSNGMPAGRGPV